MDSDRLISTPENRALVANQGGPGHRVCYVEPASTADVMFDQLGYLVAHDSHVCPIGCEDCIRLKQVER